MLRWLKNYLEKVQTQEKLWKQVGSYLSLRWRDIYIYFFFKSPFVGVTPLYQEELANPQSHETFIDGQGNPGICITTLGSLTGFLLVTSHNPAPFLSTPSIFLWSLTTDGIEGGGLGHLGESYSTFLGLPIYLWVIHVNKLPFVFLSLTCLFITGGSQPRT